MRDAEDRRKVIIEVTAQAVDMGWAFFGPVIDAAAMQMRTFDPGELAVAERFLDAMVRATGAQASQHRQAWSRAGHDPA